MQCIVDVWSRTEGLNVRRRTGSCRRHLPLFSCSYISHTLHAIAAIVAVQTAQARRPRFRPLFVVASPLSSSLSPRAAAVAAGRGAGAVGVGYAGDWRPWKVPIATMRARRWRFGAPAGREASGVPRAPVQDVVVTVDASCSSLSRDFWRNLSLRRELCLYLGPDLRLWFLTNIPSKASGQKRGLFEGPCWERHGYQGKIQFVSRVH